MLKYVIVFIHRKILHYSIKLFKLFFFFKKEVILFFNWKNSHSKLQDIMMLVTSGLLFLIYLCKHIEILLWWRDWLLVNLRTWIVAALWLRITLIGWTWIVALWLRISRVWRLIIWSWLRNHRLIRRLG